MSIPFHAIGNKRAKAKAPEMIDRLSGFLDREMLEYMFM